jgi:hypothetical protein
VQELKLSDDSNKDPSKLLKECLAELEEKGFINLMGESTEKQIV